ncbi:MAG: hypothetical protein IT338_00450 [Thermomicrobiales bacterium]|nr:hypothetical protein [Thermomicrobiales bacterium]
MDERAFEDLTREVAGAQSRRDMIRVLAGALSASAAGLVAGQRVVAAEDVGDEAFGYCRPQRKPCKRNKQCCSGRCKKNGTCGCIKKGGSCLAGVGVIVCCSGKCNKGKCK